MTAKHYVNWKRTYRLRPKGGVICQGRSSLDGLWSHHWCRICEAVLCEYSRHYRPTYRRLLAEKGLFYALWQLCWCFLSLQCYQIQSCCPCPGPCPGPWEWSPCPGPDPWWKVLVNITDQITATSSVLSLLGLRWPLMINCITHDMDTSHINLWQALWSQFTVLTAQTWERIARRCQII